MAFELPRMVDLTNDQLDILNASHTKNMLVSGAPGTGKSVLAIYRASDLSRERKKTLLLVYNKPLMSYISSAIRSLDLTAEVSTYHSWLWSVYKNVLRKRQPSNDDYQWDFDVVINDFRQLGFIYDCILIDEAQDFPLKLVEALTYVGKTVSCFMDKNQRIINGRFTRYQDYAQILKVNTKYTLTENFRNTQEIYDYAKLYQEDDDITTSKNGEKPLFVKVDSSAAEYDTIGKVILNNSTSTIGVFTNYNQQEQVANEIRKRIGNRVPISIYNSKSDNNEFKNINFDRTGVFILSTNTMKGLEFDVVIIPDVDKLLGKKDASISANIMYVAATRASSDLYCFYSDTAAKRDCIDVFTPLLRKKDIVEWE